MKRKSSYSPPAREEEAIPIFSAISFWQVQRKQAFDMGKRFD
jgi:hypothetical protein